MKNRLHVIMMAVLAVAMVAAFALVGCSSGGSASASASSASASAAAASSEAASSEAASDAASSAAAATSSAAASSAAATSAEAVQLSVFAANSLEKALPEVEALYTAQNPNVTFVQSDTGFAASGTLVETLTAEPTAADVLITASAGSMDDAEAAKIVDSASRANMFVNDLVLAVKQGSDLSISSVEDLAGDSIASFAMGEPNTVPAGKYALQTLESAGLATYETAEDGTIENIEFDASIADKANAGADKVGTVASYVSEGQCDAGFVYTSDIYRYDVIEAAFTVPADMHKAITYPGAVCAQSANATAAQAFLDFCMTNPEAQQIFAEYGFELAA